MRPLSTDELTQVSGGDNPTFNYVNGTQDDQAALASAIGYLKQSPYARTIFDTNDTVNVQFVNNTASEGYDPGTNTISWDPSHGLQLFIDRDTATTDFESAALNFFHEFYHSQDPKYADPQTNEHFFPTNTLAQLGFESMIEFRAVQAANEVAVDLGEPIRANYFGGDHSGWSVTDNSGDLMYSDPALTAWNEQQIRELASWFGAMNVQFASDFLSNPYDRFGNNGDDRGDS